MESSKKVRNRAMDTVLESLLDLKLFGLSLLYTGIYYLINLESGFSMESLINNSLGIYLLYLSVLRFNLLVLDPLFHLDNVPRVGTYDLRAVLNLKSISKFESVGYKATYILGLFLPSVLLYDLLWSPYYEMNYSWVLILLDTFESVAMFTLVSYRCVLFDEEVLRTISSIDKMKVIDLSEHHLGDITHFTLVHKKSLGLYNCIDTKPCYTQVRGKWKPGIRYYAVTHDLKVDTSKSFVRDLNDLRLNFFILAPIKSESNT